MTSIGNVFMPNTMVQSGVTRIFFPTAEEKMPQPKAAAVQMAPFPQKNMIGTNSIEANTLMQEQHERVLYEKRMLQQNATKQNATKESASMHTDHLIRNLPTITDLKGNSTEANEKKLISDLKAHEQVQLRMMVDQEEKKHMNMQLSMQQTQYNNKVELMITTDMQNGQKVYTLSEPTDLKGKEDDRFLNEMNVIHQIIGYAMRTLANKFPNGVWTHRGWLYWMVMNRMLDPMSEGRASANLEQFPQGYKYWSVQAWQNYHNKLPLTVVAKLEASIQMVLLLEGIKEIAVHDMRQMQQLFNDHVTLQNASTEDEDEGDTMEE